MIHVVGAENQFVGIMYQPVVNLTRPIESESLCDQVAGRGTRTDDAKENLGLTESVATYCKELLGYRVDIGKHVLCTGCRRPRVIRKLHAIEASMCDDHIYTHFWFVTALQKAIWSHVSVC